MRNILIVIAAFIGMNHQPLAAQVKKVFTIDKKTVYQEIDNFSASDAWRCAFIGKIGLKKRKKK